jgi:hypothetical protein
VRLILIILLPSISSRLYIATSYFSLVIRVLSLVKNPRFISRSNNDATYYEQAVEVSVRYYHLLSLAFPKVLLQIPSQSMHMDSRSHVLLTNVAEKTWKALCLVGELVVPRLKLEFPLNGNRGVARVSIQTVGSFIVFW